MARKKRTRRLLRNKPKSPKANILPNHITAVIGAILVICGVGYLLWQRSVLSFSHAPSPAPVSENQSFYPQPVRIQIPSVGIDDAITPSRIVRGIWQTSATGASHLDISARPGQPGNIILYGHNYDHIFKALSNVQVGQSIMVSTSDGNTRLYQVTQTKTVRPDEIESIEPTEHEVLTVYTCVGFLDTKRFIVQATPL